MREFVVTSGVFLVSGLIYTLWERARPRQPIAYRQVIRRDLAALFIVLVLSAVAEWIAHPLRSVIESFAQLNVRQVTSAMTLSFWLRLVVFYFVWDFTMYWFHRLMHQPFFWPTHRWHHAPTTLWWLAGIRGSLFHTLLFQIAFFWFWLFQLPNWVYLILLGEYVTRNGWMHLNVSLPGQKWIEILIVTPRYHAVHHTDRPEWYNQNLGSLMTIWDRFFGTYINPDDIDGELKYGLENTPSLWRMVLGVD